MEPLPLPSSLAEVEALIRALYQPAPPETISQIQEVLQRLQKSAEGWHLAQSLLSNPEENIKFFGALTLTVKLNTDSSVLSEDDAKELLQNLVGWLVRCVENGTSALVVRKLCSALATYFIHFSQIWTRCIQHLLHCLDLGRSVPVEDVDEALHVNALVGQLSLNKLQAAIWFAGTLVEDVGKTDMRSAKYAEVHKRLVQNAADVTPLLRFGLTLDQSQDPKKIAAQEESIKCFQSWILYAQRSSLATDALVFPLRTLVDIIINFLPVPELYEAAVELLTDTLTNYSAFFTEAHYSSLGSMFESHWSQGRYRALVVQGDFDWDCTQFGQLMLAYGDARVCQLIESTDDGSQGFLSGLSGLTGAPGFLVGEDKIFAPALEFWATFVETMTDMIYDTSEDHRPPWFPKAMDHIMRVVSNSWRKVQWPAVETILTWELSDRCGFKEARKDVADLLQAVFVLSGPSLISMFVDLLLQYLPTSSWAELEATAFCLGSLADCISDSDRCDNMLSKVFSSDFFALLSQAQSQMPLRARQTFLALIERYSDYFERHSEHLPSALNILFEALGDSALGGGSARTIATLCNSCRHILTGEVPAFIGQYGAMYHRQPIDSVAEERVVTGIAAIIQSIAENDMRLEAFSQLFSFARMDIERSVRLATGTLTMNGQDPLFQRGMEANGLPQSHNNTAYEEDIPRQLCVRGLRCILGMAKGVQSVIEGPIDLDATEWEGERGDQLSGVQANILGTLNQALVAFPSSLEVIQTICDIFRAGFSESDPGPFVFPPETVTNFFTSLTINTPQIGTVLSTACSFLSSVFGGQEEQESVNLGRLLPWVMSLLQAMPDPESDIELSQNAIEFVQRLMSSRPDILFQLQPSSMIEFIFMYTLRALDGSNPLPKYAAAEFWTTFITLKSKDPLKGANQPVQDAISGAMEHLGPLVSRSLIFNVGGNAARSELDKLCDPLKKLVVNQTHSRAWLEQALFAEDFPSTKVSPEEKNLFLKKIINLRGARNTNLVVREFWLACRGSQYAYAS